MGIWTYTNKWRVVELVNMWALVKSIFYPLKPVQDIIDYLKQKHYIVGCRISVEIKYLTISTTADSGEMVVCC